MQSNPLTPYQAAGIAAESQRLGLPEHALTGPVPPALADWDAVMHTDPYETPADRVTTAQLWATLFGWLCAVAVIWLMAVWFGGQGR